jgi:manganese/iron transport system permease protein
MLDWLVAPLAFDFMQRGLVVAMLTGTVCALLSCYLVLKGWSLMGDAISHAVFPGVVIAFVLGLPMALGAFASGLFCALASGYFTAQSRVKEDAVMAIVFSGLFALGIVLFVKVETDQHLTHLLFGNMLGVSWRDVLETAIIAVPVLGIILVKRRDFMLYCFDEVHARAIGLPVRGLHIGLLALMAMTIVAALQAIGVILVVAMLIMPGAVAMLLTRRFERMMLVAVLVSVASCVIGALISFHINAASGPTIVVTQAAIFTLALLVSLLRRRVAAASA